MISTPLATFATLIENLGWTRVIFWLLSYILSCWWTHFWFWTKNSFSNCTKTSSNDEWHTFDFHANLTYGSLTDDTFSFCLNRQSAFQRCSLTQETQKYKTSHWFVTHCQNMLMLFLDSPHPPVIFALCTTAKSILSKLN